MIPSEYGEKKRIKHKRDFEPEKSSGAQTQIKVGEGVAAASRCFLVPK